MSLNNLNDRLGNCFAGNLYPVLAILLGLFTSTATADEVYLKDGSRLVGQIKQLSDNRLMMNTAFAKNLAIEKSNIAGITSTEKLVVTLESGDRLAGVLSYSEKDGQRLTRTSFGDIALDGQNKIAGIWHQGADNPELESTSKEHEQAVAELRKEHEQEVTRIKQSYETELKQVKSENADLLDAWSGNIGLGISGKRGNTDTFAFQGRGEANMDTGVDRLMLYVEGDLQEQNDITTANEVLTGGTLEHDLTRRWFVFGSADFEKDEFEDLDLRGVVQSGFGYFFVREPHFYFKGLAGL
ncbi:MAG: DUF481 domain-containing protein, partial [Gammaproteobacteria bacterium]|nr:DUF481 domain-containing protein [Gammaproteobacteria bacterium]